MIEHDGQVPIQQISNNNTKHTDCLLVCFLLSGYCTARLDQRKFSRWVSFSFTKRLWNWPFTYFFIAIVHILVLPTNRACWIQIKTDISATEYPHYSDSQRHYSGNTIRIPLNEILSTWCFKQRTGFHKKLSAFHDAAKLAQFNVYESLHNLSWLFTLVR